MFEADIHLGLCHTSILDIYYKVFESLVCCLKGIWVHPYTIPLAKLVPDLDLGILGHLWSGNDTITSCLRLTSTSDCVIHPYWTYTKWLSQCNSVSRAYGCSLITFHSPSWPQIWGFWVAYGVEMMPLCHVWGWHLPQTLSYIHIRHILQSVWVFSVLSQGHMGASLSFHRPSWSQIW